MKFEVPVRKVDVYKAEDGRVVEHHVLQHLQSTEVNTQEKIEFRPETELFIGVSPDENIPLKFLIQGASSLTDAFDKYVSIWSAVRSQIEDQMKNRIQTATEADLQALDKAAEKGKIIL